MSALAIRTSYVLAGDRPLLVLDARHGDVDGPLTAEHDPALWSFTDLGLRLLPGFFGVNLTEETPLSLVRTAGELALTAEGGHVSVSSPIDDIPMDWIGAVEDEGGAILIVGRAIGAADHDDPADALKAIDAAAKAGRVLGAVVDLRLLPLG